jgi:hypothetical protein
MFAIHINKNPVGKGAREGESPVLASMYSDSGILSRAGSEKPRLK